MPRLVREDTTSEETYYPVIKDLWAGLLEFAELPFEVRTGTKQRRARGGMDRPDIALYDAGEFVSVFGEVKLPRVRLADLAKSTENDNQVGRYLGRTGIVLLSNVRSFGLLACKAGYARKSGEAVPPEARELLQVADLWSSEEALARGSVVGDQALHDLLEIIERAATEFAPIADPATLARILARLARRAKLDLPDTLETLEGLRQDFKASLGLTFEGKEGLEFFKSSLIQTAFYGLFAGWTLWHRTNDGRPFEWDRMERYLRIPFLAQLFHDFKHPDRMEELRLAPHLDRATDVLGRVERGPFFLRFTYGPISTPPGLRVVPTTELAPEKAITYFYEPFLEAFDPELRKSLGVWYTPSEIVRYQVRRVEHLLKTEFDCERGFADERVVVLDPCCGTGAYLLEVVKCIRDEFHSRGEGQLLPAEIHAAVTKRLLGFEILTAPFVIAQLQLYLYLSDLGVAPSQKERPAVFLTNALAGWGSLDTVKGLLSNPALQKEHQLARKAKQDAKVIVVLGNPPYNRFAGSAIAEEGNLVDHYKGVRRRQKTDRSGKPVFEDGHPVMIQSAESDLYRVWRVRKQLLDDLYVRFIRLAEVRIAEQSEYGIVSMISNSSYLTGRSHPIMRESILRNFHEAWIDNLNGDKYKTGKVIPAGLPGAGSPDQSIFTSEHDARGIQVGTCISTFVKRKTPRTDPSETLVHYREFWGKSEEKRRSLLASLSLDDWEDVERRSAAIRPAGPRQYEEIHPSRALRWLLAPREANAGYDAWAALDELFPTNYHGVSPNRGLEGSLIDTDQDALILRMRDYFGNMSFAAFEAKHSELVKPRSRYSPEALREELHTVGFRKSQVQSYLTFPLDQRWIYYETEAKLLDERSPEVWENLLGNEFLLTVPQSRKVSETRPLLARTLFGNHVYEVGARGIPRETRDGPLALGTVANLAPPAWRALKRVWKLQGELRDDDAKKLVSRLFRLALAIVHSPAYQEESGERLGQDWAQLPVPRKQSAAAQATALGDQLASLLDPSRDVEALVSDVLGLHRMRHLAVLSTADKRPVQPGGEALTFSYFGGGKGKYLPRPFREEEQAHAAWGSETGELWINKRVFVGNVPIRVWEYELGGYPLLKKWLGYRQQSHRDGRLLTIAEMKMIRSIVHRIASVLALGSALDRVYEACSTNALTAVDLGLRE
ncbi:MAG TPA: type ISP restriction/modification enzyme [Polyangiaceae bacterium]|nr:type ISP restriction/modification enzyme [Polyangiaceae bacterium]